MEIEKADESLVLETAMEAGHILLENGAEIFRVEETMDRICRHFGVESNNFFVLSNGIFATGGDGKERTFAKVQHIPMRAARLDRVVAVNQLSREVEEKGLTIEEVRNIGGGALVTLICILCYNLGLGDQLNHMIIGSIIPLIPGVPFTNGIRDIADGDYISGAVRLLDAILVFLCIAIGVGVMFTIYRRFAGGAML